MFGVGTQGVALGWLGSGLQPFYEGVCLKSGSQLATDPRRYARRSHLGRLGHDGSRVVSHNENTPANEAENHAQIQAIAASGREARGECREGSGGSASTAFGAGRKAAECDNGFPQRAPPDPSLRRVWAGEAHSRAIERAPRPETKACSVCGAHIRLYRTRL